MITGAVRMENLLETATNLVSQASPLNVAQVSTVGLELNSVHPRFLLHFLRSDLPPNHPRLLLSNPTITTVVRIVLSQVLETATNLAPSAKPLNVLLESNVGLESSTALQPMEPNKSKPLTTPTKSNKAI
jgi:hypothetical protein